jgi:hypothetical protein
VPTQYAGCRSESAMISVVGLADSCLFSAFTCSLYFLLEAAYGFGLQAMNDTATQGTMHRKMIILLPKIMNGKLIPLCML